MEGTKFYLSYEQPKPGAPAIMQVIPYDLSHGFRQVGSMIFIHHGSRIIHELYDSVDEAIRSLHTYGKPVRLPDGTQVRPREANGYADPVFIPWHPGVREVWPGESGYPQHFA